MDTNIGSSKTWAIFEHPQISTELRGPKDPNFGQFRSCSRPRTHLGSEHIPRYPLACRGVAVFLTCATRPQLGSSNPICNFEEKTVSCFWIYNPTNLVDMNLTWLGIVAYESVLQNPGSTQPSIPHLQHLTSNPISPSFFQDTRKLVVSNWVAQRSSTSKRSDCWLGASPNGGEDV